MSNGRIEALHVKQERPPTVLLPLLFTGPNDLLWSGFFQRASWARCDTVVTSTRPMMLQEINGRGKGEIWSWKIWKPPLKPAWREEEEESPRGNCRGGLVVNGAQLENCREMCCLYISVSVSDLHNYTFIYRSVCLRGCLRMCVCVCPH